jgi:tetratricopeptide (TPR) repeat protein
MVICDVFMEMDELEQARDAAVDALSLSRRLKNRAGQAEALKLLADIARREADFSRALALYREALAARPSELPKVEVGARIGMAEIHLTRGDAAVALEEVRSLLERPPDSLGRRERQTILLVLVRIYEDLGQLEAALAAMRELRALDGEIHRPGGGAAACPRRPCAVPAATSGRPPWDWRDQPCRRSCRTGGPWDRSARSRRRRSRCGRSGRP